MKIRNRELKTEISIGFEVVTNLYFQWAKFEVDKHRFKHLLWGIKFLTVIN